MADSPFSFFCARTRAGDCFSPDAPSGIFLHNHYVGIAAENARRLRITIPRMREMAAQSCASYHPYALIDSSLVRSFHHEVR
jgi:hypothetical protein